jgi:ribonuclease P protein component
MLPLKNRLKKEKDFENVFKNGRGFNENLLRLKIIPNDLADSRFGFVVSKKYSKKATERNSIKRRLREITQKDILNIKEGFDVVLFVMPELENDFDKLTDITRKLLKKSRLLKQ